MRKGAMALGLVALIGVGAVAAVAMATPSEKERLDGLYRQMLADPHSLTVEEYQELIEGYGEMGDAESDPHRAAEYREASQGALAVMLNIYGGGMMQPAEQITTQHDQSMADEPCEAC